MLLLMYKNKGEPPPTYPSLSSATRYLRPCLMNSLLWFIITRIHFKLVQECLLVLSAWFHPLPNLSPPPQVFPDVTILFSDVVGFTRICSHITPMQVVSMLNTMYTLFDTLSEKHRVFKVCVCVCVFIVCTSTHIQYLFLWIRKFCCDALCRLKPLAMPTWWWLELQRRQNITLITFVTWLWTWCAPSIILKIPPMATTYRFVSVCGCFSDSSSSFLFG